MAEEVASVSLSMAFGKFSINVKSTNWVNTVIAASEGLVKARVIQLLERNITYSSELGGWFPFTPEELSGIKERIALSLLLTHPNRIARSVLSAISNVKSGSLANYLTKDELEVLPYIEENEEGIILNQAGCNWASQILESLDNRRDGLEDE